MTENSDEELAAAARPLPGIGREAIRAKLEKREPEPGIEPAGILARPFPVFVTLRLGQDLRGCIGSLSARCANLVEETRDRACAAAFEDPRFPPLTAGELPMTSIEISILGPLQRIASRDELDPQRYGIEVSDGQGRRAVLLPEIAGVDTVEEQIAVTRRKARIDAAAQIEIRRFSVVKVEEPR